MELETLSKEFYPKTYYDKESRQNSNFYFISYSHKDKQLVYDVLFQIYEAGINYWYDVNLDLGDKWNERVEKEMRNEHCQGAIIFLSENSLISNAVQQEIKIMLDISKKRNFRIVPVIIGYDTANQLILKVATTNDDFYVKSYDDFRNITIEKLWVKYDESVEKIISFSEKDNIKDAFIRSFVREVKHKSENGERTFLLGQYPLEEDCALKDIEWIEICNNGDLFYFVSKFCLDFVDKKNIGNVIEKIRQTMLPFQYIEKVALINETFINDNLNAISKSVPTDFADRNRQQLLRLFWVLEGNGNNEKSYVLYNSNNHKINNNIQVDRINAGLRLILIINNNKIGEK